MLPHHIDTTDALEKTTRPSSYHVFASAERFSNPLPKFSPFPRNTPWWSLKAPIHIDMDKEIAEAHHLRTTSQLNDTTVQIYTDGSGINEGIGAAMYCHTGQHVEPRYLGKNSESMVYAGELEAIHMAVAHIKDLTQMESHVFSDSQTAMKSLAKPKRQSGQAIIKRILDEIDALYLARPSYALQLAWVPGHVGIEGNEREQIKRQRVQQLRRSTR